MSKYNSLGGLFTAIANAIRAKTGGTDPIVAEDFPAAVEGISAGGGDIDALIDGSLTEITSNAESVKPYALCRHTTIESVNFPKAISILASAFAFCTTLKTVNFPSAKNIGSNQTTEGSMFQGCTALETINFPLVEKIGAAAFKGCSALTSIDFPSATLIADNAFENCNKITSIHLPNFTGDSNTWRAQYGFKGCSSLTSVTLPKAKNIHYEMFGYCSRLARVDFPLATMITSNAFYCDYSLTAIVLRSETICSLDSTYALRGCYHFDGTVNSTYNPDGLKDGYIYVPRALIEDYKVATNWTTFATQFRALEDYTVDGTTTGELDESKVNA